MVFSSISFLSGFLVIVFLLHTLIPNMIVKNALLILFSLAFYAVGEPVYVLLMIGCSLLNYEFGRLIGYFSNRENPGIKKLLLMMAVISNITVLFLFKYLNFTIDIINKAFGTGISARNLVMPIGISFFTFQAMSYVIDVYRGTCPCQKNYFKVLLYICFFPQLIAGPIVKYRDIEAEITDRKQSFDDIESGIRRFIVGLSKKVLISNALAQIVDTMMPDSEQFGMAAAWLMAVSYTLQIYYDFSGYSDMAIGLGRMFGFHFKENFDYPYASLSIKEFWRRWHISLSAWFKEYVYIPLGGNRKGRKRTILNKFIVFLLTGIWHGANFTFIIWGLLHGTFSVLEENEKLSIKRIPFKPIQYIYTMLIVICAFVLFRADTVSQGVHILVQMFGFKSCAYGTMLAKSVLTPYAVAALLCGIICMTPWMGKLYIRIQNSRKMDNKSVAKGEQLVYVASGVFLLALLLFCMIQLASDAYNPFIYFRF